MRINPGKLEKRFLPKLNFHLDYKKVLLNRKHTHVSICEISKSIAKVKNYKTFYSKSLRDYCH